MTFEPAKGSWTSRYYRSKASTAYTVGSVVYTDGTDVIPAVATTEDILGICVEAKAATDTTNKAIKIMVPRSLMACTMYGTVGNGTLTAAYEGRLCDLDNTAPSTAVDIETTTESCLRIEKFITASKGEFSIIGQKR